jgi:preprotein translocase subunit YajC
MNAFLFPNLPLLLGAPQGGAAGQGGGGGQLVTMLITFGLIIVIFYFLVIRPQNKKQKDAKKMLESLRKGDRVVTAGGMRGTIASVKPDKDSVVLEVDANVKIEFSRSAVTQVLERKEEPAEESKE